MLEHGSYKIELCKQVITVRFVGAWNKETSLKMCDEFQQEAKKIAGNPWACLIDLTKWELGGPEVWEPILQINHWCTENNQQLEAVVCSNLIQKYIVKELEKALPETESAFFSTEIEAKKWLNQYRYEI